MALIVHKYGGTSMGSTERILDYVETAAPGTYEVVVDATSVSRTRSPFARDATA